MIIIGIQQKVSDKTTYDRDLKTAISRLVLSLWMACPIRFTSIYIKSCPIITANRIIKLNPMNKNVEYSQPDTFFVVKGRDIHTVDRL